MTEQPDTAAIRAAIETMHASQLYDEVTILCDALDGARAEVARLKRWVEREASKRAEAVEARFLVACAESREHCERADNAEAERDGCRATLALVAITREKRAEAAEARIAAALAVMDADPHDVDLEVRRALTEGTGQ